MKTLRMFAIAFLTILVGSCFTSCKDKEDGNSFNYSLESIYGTWKVTQYKNKPTDNYVTWNMASTTITFYSQNKYTSTGVWGNAYGTYSASGDDISLTCDGASSGVITILGLNTKYAEIKYTAPNFTVTYLLCTKQ